MWFSLLKYENKKVNGLAFNPIQRPNLFDEFIIFGKDVCLYAKTIAAKPSKTINLEAHNKKLTQSRVSLTDYKLTQGSLEVITESISGLPKNDSDFSCAVYLGM